MTAVKRRGGWEILSSIAGAAIYILFAVDNAIDLAATHRPSSLIALILVSVFAFFFIVRAAPKQVNLSVRDWVVALCGTYFPLLLRPAPEAHDILVLQMIQVIGSCIAIGGILSLNKSLGLVAANRGVKTTGFYKHVRHPIYAGYAIHFIAYWLQNMTLPNTIFITAGLLFELARIFAEEQHLKLDREYAAYMKKVRWRLIPYIF